MTAAHDAAGLFVRLLEPAARADPYPLYRRLCALGPVGRGPARTTVVSGYAACNALLRDPRMSSDHRNSTAFRELVAQGRLSEEERASLDQRTFLMLDPPDHTRLRRLVSRAFTPRVVAQLRPRIEAIIDDLLAAARRLDPTSIEVVESLAYPLPVTVISELLGVPRPDRVGLADMSRPLSQALDPPFTVAADEAAAIRGAVGQLTAYLDALVTRRRAEPGDDLVSALAAVADDDAGAGIGGRRGLTHDEIVQTCLLLLLAGHETTVNLIGNGALALLRDPAAHVRLRDGRTSPRAFVEEVLRHDPPVQFRTRVALERVEVAGQEVGEGEVLVLLLAAANRDPAVFEAPDRFRPARYEPGERGPAAEGHLSFGAGIHYCLGAALARLEGELALQALAGLIPVGAGPPERLRYRPGAALRGLAALQVSTEPSAVPARS